jgi:ATP/maltotriose-dependent transcriptional regulator MalT
MAREAEIFVGRRRELEALYAALDAACEGRGRLALLAGEPGIGKSRLALELTAQAAGREAGIAWGRCHEEAGAPAYRPWTQILGAVAATQEIEELRADLGAGGPDIAEIVPELRTRLPDLDPPAAALSDASETRFRLFGSIVRFLVNSSRRRPLVLILDDLHWADAPTLRLLEFLTQEMAESRLLVIGTYRDTDVSRRHQLSDTLGALIRVPQTTRLHLSGLDIDDVSHFATTAAGMALPPWLTNAIHGQTEGNPLFVREVVRFLAQEGHFKLALSATIPPTIRLPEGIREAIGRRLNLLSATCNDVLATAAVIGHEFRLDVLMRASRPHNDDVVVEAIDQALSAHIVEEIDSGSFQFTHTLLRITLYDELRTGERRRRHNAVGEAIEVVYRHDPAPVLSNLAYHFRAAGMGGSVDRAIDYATRAGHNADAALAFEEAINLFQNALDMLDTKEADDPDLRCGLLLSLARAQEKLHDEGAPATLRAAADIARSRKLYDIFAEAALSYAEVVVRYVEHLDVPSELLQEALDYLPPSELRLRTKIMSSLARVRLHQGRLDEARAIGSHAIAMARRQNDPATLAMALAGLADFPYKPHETDEALRDATEMAEAATSANDLEVAIRAHFRRSTLLLEGGDIQGATATIDEMARLNTYVRQPFFDAYVHSCKARLALMRGSLGEAEELIRRIQRLRLPQQPVNDPAAQMMFTLRRERDQLGMLGPVVAMFVRQTAAVAVWRPALALLYVELGDLGSARAVFDELAPSDFQSIPEDARWTTCIAYLAEVCVALDDRVRASRLYKLLLPWSGRNIGVGLECLGSSDRFLGLLAAIERRWGDAERHFEQALEMNDRIGAILPREHTRRDYAEMLARRNAPGDGAKASALLDIAEGHASALGLIALGRRITLTRQLLTESPPKSATPDNLTGRELDVLRLIAIGRGNADIALALTIGQSTVATHVHNILTKTGCANRTEAAAYAARLGLLAGKNLPST